MTRYTADVIVIGAGIAGVVAAIELLERGRRVLLLDRDVEANMGALAKESFGGIWFAGTPLQKRYGIRDGAEQGLRDWHAFAEFGPDDHWPRAWAEAYVQRANEEIFDWLRGIGVQFMPMPLWVERGLHTPGNSVPRWHIVWGTGHELAVVTNRHLLAHPRRNLLELRFGHRVESLVTTNGAVTGCRGVLEGSGRRVRSPGRSRRDCRGRHQRRHRARQAELARGLEPPARDDPERLAQVCGWSAARRGGDARRQRHAPRLAVELRGRRPSLEAAQTGPRTLAGAAEIRAVAQLARRADRPDAARDRLRHARPRGADLPAAARLFLAAAQPPDRVEGARGLGQRVQPGVPRQEDARRGARHAARQSLAVCAS